MSYTFYVKAEGVAECLKTLDAKDKKVRAGVRKALRRGGTRVKRSAKQKVGRKTGNLKKSITNFLFMCWQALAGLKKGTGSKAIMHIWLNMGIKVQLPNQSVRIGHYG